MRPGEKSPRRAESEDLLMGDCTRASGIGAEEVQPDWNAEKGRGGLLWAAGLFFFCRLRAVGQTCGRNAAGKEEIVMRRTKERLLSILLAVVMVIGLLPGTVWAAESTQIGNVTFSVETKTVNGGYLVAPMEEALFSGDTVYTILSRVAQEKDLTVSGADTGYVTKIENFGSYTDSDYGTESGWMAAVNNDHATWPLPALKDGDSVRFCYTYKTYGYDIDLIDSVERLKKKIADAETKLGEDNPFSEGADYLENSQSKYNALATAWAAASEKVDAITAYKSNRAYLDAVNIYGPGSEAETVKKLVTQLQYALDGSQYIAATGATISISGSPAHIYEGKSYRVSAAVTPENATIPVGTWAVVEVTGKGTITSDGLFTPTKAGMVILQYWHPDAENGTLSTKLLTIEEDTQGRQMGELMEKIALSYVDNYTDWVIMDMAAYEDYNSNTTQKTSATAKQNYINAAASTLATGKTPEGSAAGDTAYDKIILATQSIGINPRSLYPVNSNTPLDAVAALNKTAQSTSAWSAPFTLAAYQQGSYGSDAYEKVLIKGLLDSQQADGSWSEYGTIDTTANVIAGLSFYCDADLTVKTAVNKAVEYLSGQQKATGAYDDGQTGAYAAGINANSTAMVVVALASVGIDPDTDARFVKSGKSALDGLLSFALADNSGFGYSNGEAISGYATEQGFRALIAAAQVMKNNRAYNVYDFSGNSVEPGRATGSGTVVKPSNPSTDRTISVYFSLKSDVDYWIPRTAVIVKEGSTVYHAFTKALDSAGITYVGAENGYVRSITKGSKTLAEFANGENSGWLYKVNGTVLDIGLTSCSIQNGDNIVWYYTNDWTKDSGAGGFQTSGKTKVTESKDGTYSVILPEDSEGPVLVTIPDVGAGQVVVIVRKDGTQEVVRKSRLQDGTAYLLLKENATVKVMDYVSDFDDVKSTAWYASAVDFAVSRELFSGVGEGIFGPELPLNRGMLVTVLYALEQPGKQSAKELFADVNTNAWYAQGTAWGVETGIVSGYGNGLFGPEDYITREQLALMLYKYANSLGMNIGGRNSLTGFRDGGDVSTWAKGAMAWAVNAGILGGRTEGTLDPGGNATRAEAAAMLRQFMALMLK